jgi:hypothetical protein
MTDNIRYMTFNTLESEGVTHAIFMRHGGVSPSPWDSLNFGGTVGDEAKNVFENRRRAFQYLGLNHRRTFDAWQVHSTNIAIANGPRPQDVPHEKADIILSNHPGIVLLMRFADCVPLLFYDPQNLAIGIAHAGWQGTVKGVASVVVEAMKERYQTQPRELITVIGPSIGPDHYAVGPDVVERVRLAFGSDTQEVLHKVDGSEYLDLWQANYLQLDRAGVRSIQIAQVCTACNMTDWYSHRGQHGRTGRFGAIITLMDG